MSFGLKVLGADLLPLLGESNLASWMGESNLPGLVGESAAEPTSLKGVVGELIRSVLVTKLVLKGLLLVLLLLLSECRGFSRDCNELSEVPAEGGRECDACSWKLLQVGSRHMAIDVEAFE